jgi:hypothetical protein
MTLQVKMKTTIGFVCPVAIHWTEFIEIGMDESTTSPVGHNYKEEVQIGSRELISLRF